jgi:NMD protein affecting ribosome stability and mRNA decay
MMMACEECGIDYDDDIEGADGMCEDCYGDQFEEED